MGYISEDITLVRSREHVYKSDLSSPGTMEAPITRGGRGISGSPWDVPIAIPREETPPSQPPFPQQLLEDLFTCTLTQKGGRDLLTLWGEQE